MGDTYMTRHTLLRRLKSRCDEDAWEEFVANYRPFIYSIINKMEINPSDVDDLSQSILLKIWKSLDRFDINKKKGHFRNWIYTITRNTVLTYIADSNYIERSKEEAESRNQTLETPNIDDMIQKEWERFIFEKAFSNIRAKMSEKLLDAFQSGLRGEPETETAERLGLEPKTVNKYKNRVKYKLIAEIENLRELLE